MKNNFGINLDKYSTPTVFAIITALFLLAASFCCRMEYLLLVRCCIWF